MAGHPERHLCVMGAPEAEPWRELAVIENVLRFEPDIWSAGGRDVDTEG
jgi:hypothetical protein